MPGKFKKGHVTLMALPFTLKKYLKTKEEELWKLKYYFTMQKYINLQNKKSSKRSQNPSRYNNNSVTNRISSFNTSQNIIIFQKSSYNNNNNNRSIIISSFKNSHIKIDPLLLLLLLLPSRGQNPLKLYYILYNESKHNILALVVGQGQ